MPGDAEFQFGRVKTAMILFCIDTIEKFALADNPGMMIPQPINYKPDPDLDVQLQTFSSFSKNVGVEIERPYLRLEGEVKNRKSLVHIGFGQMKAAALVILKKELEAWLQSVHGWYK